MSYILANKEWIFSGIGILILTLIWNIFFKKKLNNDPNNPIPVNNNVNNNNINVFTDSSPVSHLLGDSRAIAPPTASEKMRIRVLFVDDDTRFKVVNILKKAGWTYTKSKVDIINLEDSDVVESQVIFVDINGVGSTLFKDEGLGLAVALKSKYPNKKIVIYSAEQHGDRFHKALRTVDEVLSKNAEPYEFINLLETFSKELLA